MLHRVLMFAIAMCPASAQGALDRPVFLGDRSPCPATTFAEESSQLSTEERQDVDDAIAMICSFAESLPAGPSRDELQTICEDLRRKLHPWGPRIGKVPLDNDSRGKTMPDWARPIPGTGGINPGAGGWGFRRAENGRSGNWILLDENDWDPQGGDYRPEGKNTSCPELAIWLLAITMYHEGVRCQYLDITSEDLNWECEFSKFNLALYSSSRLFMDVLPWPPECYPPSMVDQAIVEGEKIRRDRWIRYWADMVDKNC